MSAMFLLRQGRGGRRRVAHASMRDPKTGRPTLTPMCGSPLGSNFSMTAERPWGCRVCEHCGRLLHLREVKP